MIVTCEECQARFRLPDDKVGPSGAKVRCSRCQHTFVVHRDEELELADIDDVMLVDSNHAVSPPTTSPATDERRIDGVGEWRADEPAGKPPRPEGDEPAAGSAPTPAPAAVRPNSTLIELGGTQKPDFHEQETGIQDISKLTVRDKDDTDGYANNPAFATAVHEARTRVIKVPKEADVARARQEADVAKRMTEPNLDSAIVDSDLSFDDEQTGDAQTDDGTPSGLADADPFAAAAPAGIADIDPFAAGSGGDLTDELFSDLPDPDEGDSAPSDPFEGAGDIGAANRKATRQMGDVGVDVDIGTSRNEPRSRLGNLVNGLAASIGVAALAVGLAFFFAGDALLALAKRGGPPVQLPAVEGVRVLSTRSVRYPTSAGEEVLVISGDAENRSAVDRNDLYVVAELRSAAGKVLDRNRAPLGLPLGPAELTGLRDDASVAEAFAARAAATKKRGITAGGTAGFTVVLLRPPSSSNGPVPRFHLEKGEPIVVPEPAAPVEETAVSEEEPPRKGKGKGKHRKGKKRKGKKRKKKRAEGE